MNIIYQEKEVELAPSKVTATEFLFTKSYDVKVSALAIAVEGFYNGSISQTRLVAVDLAQKSPLFKVIGRTVVDEPIVEQYKVKHIFHGVAPDIQEIRIQSQYGIKSYCVNHIGDARALDLTPPSIRALNDKQAVGYAPDKSSIDIAFNKAVMELYNKFPGHISTKVVDSGIVASADFGIAFTYVVLEKEWG
ncbi:hypothetical protein [Hahella sp. NBU794]|uniref:hypothetical protein n=1 Tax=Hahella sp. NBU794 TaxID=3422590 RepID=UPI003D6F8A61